MAIAYELAIGARYTRVRRGSRRNAFISFIALSAMAGIALGVAALIAVLSVVNGFSKELRERILAVVSHVELRGMPQLADWRQVAADAAREPHVKAAAPYVAGQAMLAAGGVNRAAAVRGIDPAREEAVADVGGHMREGALADLRPGEFGIVLGAELARALQLRIGDTVALIAPGGSGRAAASLPPVHAFRLVGTFELGMYEFDNGLALVNLADAQRVYGLSGVSGVRLRLDDAFAAPFVARDLWRKLPPPIEIRDWTLSHSNYFLAVAGAKRIMSLMLVLIVAVAAFNIVSAQVMMVTDKQADIAVLRTLGAAPSSIMSIFIVQGALIGAIGVALGVLGGVVLALNIETLVPLVERMFNVQFLDKSIYHIAELPSDLQRGDVVSVAAIALALALVATIYPAWKASRVNPAEALRYE
ncbi:MAG: lipoprotein-releasing ABC transporter permease subunit [Burkholderiales bacterium]|nr:lipoprotein-releasing ABC transporter permease subunit [Burkholderiales bacterium]